MSLQRGREGDSRRQRDRENRRQREQGIEGVRTSFDVPIVEHEDREPRRFLRSIDPDSPDLHKDQHTANLLGIIQGNLPGELATLRIGTQHATEVAFHVRRL